MNKENVFKELWLIAIVLFPIALLMMVWNRLPAQMPIHWDINGQPNGYGPRWSYPVISISIYVLLLVLPSIDPLKKNYEIFGDSYFKLKLIMVLFFSATSICIMVNELYHKHLCEQHEAEQSSRNIKPGDKIHIKSRQGIYEVVSCDYYTITITCKRWSVDGSAPIKIISRNEFKCLAGGLHNWWR